MSSSIVDDNCIHEATALLDAIGHQIAIFDINNRNLVVGRVIDP
jgi:hypothetical protein